MSNQPEEIRRLVRAANDACSTRVSAEEYEAEFSAVLDFVVEHPECRNVLTSLLIRHMNEGGGCIELVEFCMHELRWPEVRQAALDKIASTDDWRFKTPLSNVVRAFDPDWPDAELYERWRK